MYDYEKCRMKLNNSLRNSFDCLLGVSQCERLSRFLFSMSVNDIEYILIHKGVSGIDVNMLKLF